MNHHPEARSQREQDLDRSLGNNHPEEIDPAVDSDHQHNEPKNRDRHFKARNEVIPSRRLKHARDDHRKPVARCCEDLQPQQFDDEPALPLLDDARHGRRDSMAWVRQDLQT